MSALITVLKFIHLHIYKLVCFEVRIFNVLYHITQVKFKESANYF